MVGSRRWRHVLIGGVAGLTVLLAGCSSTSSSTPAAGGGSTTTGGTSSTSSSAGGASTGSSSSTTSTTSAASGSTGSSTAAQDLGTLKVVTSVSQSLPFIGVEAGLNQWQGTGVSVNLVSGTSGTVDTILASGQGDIGIQAGNKAAADIAAGVPAKIVAGMLLPWDQYVIAATKTGATKPEDLKGKTFGISNFGSGGDYATEKMAQQLGWSKSDFKIVQLGHLNSLTAALKSGTIDAFLWSAEEAFNIQAAGYGKVIGDARNYVGPNAFEVIIASNDAIKNHPQAVKAFVQGYLKAVQQLQANPAQATDILVNQWKENKDAATQAVQKELPLLSTDGKIPTENLQGLADAVKFTTKGKTTIPDPSSVYTYWQDIG